MTTELQQARIDLAAAYRLAYKHGLSEGICNHFTMTVSSHPNTFLLIAYGTHWSEVTASNLLLVSLDGKIIEGNGTVEKTAFYIHAPIHRKRPDLRCLMHTHQSYTLAIALTENGIIDPVNQNALRFYDRIARDDNYSGLASDTAEGERLAAIMKDKNILLMANHGVLVGASSIAIAYDELYYLERAAMVQILATNTGRPIKKISKKICEETVRNLTSDYSQRFSNDHFSALKRILDKEQPDYQT
jgi:ribulose-5-phosphate 4-epimerase/fuculose-1-phosphate aldolase